MAEPITIPISIFEVIVVYEKPFFRLFTGHAEVTQALFDAFAEYQPNADDLEIVSTGKITDRGIKLRIASQGINLFLGITSCKFTKEAAVWGEADKILSILGTFLTIITNISGIVPGKKTSILSLHLQPKTVAFQVILRPLIVPEIQNLHATPLSAMAVVARWPGCRITLDGSAQLANGIFVQMEREFAANVSFDAIKQLIFDDEVAILKMLKVEEIEE